MSSARPTLARADPEAWDINVLGPADVAASALDAGVQRLVHCSSVPAFDLARSRPLLNEDSRRGVHGDHPSSEVATRNANLSERNPLELGTSSLLR